MPLWRDKIRPHYAATVAAWEGKPWETLSAAELWAAIQEVDDAAMLHLASLLVATTGASAGSEMLFTRVYEKLIRREGDPAAPAFLMGYDSTPIRAEKSLYDIARWCREHGDLAAYLQETPAERLATQLAKEAGAIGQRPHQFDGSILSGTEPPGILSEAQRSRRTGGGVQSKDAAIRDDRSAPSTAWPEQHGHSAQGAPLGHLYRSPVSFASALQAWRRSIHTPARPNRNPSILQLEHVSFSYDGIRPVLDDVSFDIRAGERVAIVGKNGAGKSTLSKLLCGFEREDRGVIRYRGADMGDKTIRERAEIIGLVMQNPNQMISKPLIYDEVALGLRLRHVPEEQIAERVAKALQVCGLAPFSEWPISALSYGQKKRVTVAAILVLDPQILILDEPTAGQDFRHYSDIMEFLVEINKLGVTIILITHDMHLMLEYTPRAIVLAGGRKIADTAASVVLTDPQVIAEANLKETSLYALAHKAGIADGTGFVQGFIDYEREVKGR